MKKAHSSIQEELENSTESIADSALATGSQEEIAQAKEKIEGIIKELESMTEEINSRLRRKIEILERRQKIGQEK
jgi:hypothetical protein